MPTECSDHADGLPSIEADLPEWITTLRRRADAVFDAVLSPHFPDLESKPKDDKDLDARIGAAAEWANDVARMLGDVIPNKVRAPGLLDLLANPSTNSLVVEIADDCQFNIWLQQAVSGRWVPAGVRQGSKFALRILGRSKLPSLDRPADLLGAVPLAFTEPLAATFVAQLRARDAIIIERNQLEHRIFRRTENWGEIRKVMLLGYRAVTARSLALVGWVRERTDSLIDAAWPRIELIQRPASGPWTWSVHLAGQARQIRMKVAPSVLLMDLVEKGSATSLRRAKLQLLEAIPELRAWIGPTRSRLKRSAENRGHYALAPAIRGRISVSTRR